MPLSRVRPCRVIGIQGALRLWFCLRERLIEEFYDELEIVCREPIELFTLMDWSLPSTFLLTSDMLCFHRRTERLIWSARMGRING